MGETLAAMRPGRRQERNTVIRAKSALPMNSLGSAEVTAATLLSRAVTTGVSTPPSSQPSSSPTGMPARDSMSACARMMRRSCRGVVPMVFSSP